MPYYLNAGAIQQELVNRGSHTLETVPPVGRLEYLLEILQMQIDLWLGYNPMRQMYVQRVDFARSGWRATLDSPNVTKIERITVRSGAESFDMDPASVASVWAGGQSVSLDAIGSFYTPWSNLYGGTGAYVEIEYEAGWAEAPRRFQIALVEAIAAALEHGVEWLSQPVADIQNIGMAGVSKGIRLGKGPEGEGSNLDRILATYLSKDRKVLYY